MTYGTYSKTTIGRRIKAQRVLNGMTQDDAAEAIGASANSVSNWERGFASIPFASACKLADAFGCTLDDLAGR